MDTSSTRSLAGHPRRSRLLRTVARAFGPMAKRMSGSRLFPLWALLRHTGRTSGTPYATPVVALRTSDGFLIPLPFGDATQWAKNLLAAGGGTIRSAGHEHRVLDPEVIDLDVASERLPRVVRFLSASLGIRHFVSVRQDVSTART